MAKKNNDFFKKKKAWSKVKDELLGCYFKPYMSKILHTHKPLVYIDCFAGKGKFDDGQPGSPIIVLDVMEECLAASKIDKKRISVNFIDLNYAEELTWNLAKYQDINIISGDYEKVIRPLLSTKDGCNIFLYIDPYGIKALKYSIFSDLSKRGFNSIELLINMNSFGFFREACNALGAKFEDDYIFEDLIEYSPTSMNASEQSVKALNEIAGGDYWQKIVDDYKNKNIDGYQAETIFAKQYCEHLRKSYAYVLNMPLRIKKEHRPKYRMIHATNHPSGCIIMVDNIYNRWQVIQEMQNYGQLSMIGMNFENEIVDTLNIEKKVIEHFSQYNSKVPLSKALANFFVEYGAICHTSTIKNSILNLEKKGRIKVIRIPPKTVSGQLSTFMTEGKGKSIEVRWL